ncbi:hypothetical protein LBMAG42_11950 [Deltaproteobacteria bacterium]|nr:hypothetical protein LBMAG42_11950 [Deltaproteobacteria bacterium]
MIMALLSHALADPISGYVDLHIHLAAHLTVPVYGAGPEAKAPSGLTNLHALEPQIFAEQLAEPGPTILVSLAYANPFATVFESRRSMRARMDRQLDFVEALCARHSERFGWAKTPEEARSIIASGRTAIVHGIEGATKILSGAEDATYWATRGVAVITPVHLADNEIGGAWCQEGSLRWLNLPGCQRESDPATHGLTGQGPARVRDLIDAGIVVDLAHTSDASFAEIVPILRERGVAPVYTHVTADAVRRDPTALSDAQLVEITRLGGLVGVTANLAHMRPDPVPPGLAAEHCPGTIDDFRLHWDHVVALSPGAPVAWGSDFQGGVDHIGPTHGLKGCSPAPSTADTFDIEGLAHTGLVEPMFAHLAAAGSDRAPLDASAERFLTIWERSLAARAP